MSATGTDNGKVLLTRSVLNAVSVSTRSGKQRVIWDLKQPGLCVLVSPGPKDRGKATLAFRACFYLRGMPGKPHYVKLGRFPAIITFTLAGPARRSHRRQVLRH